MHASTNRTTRSSSKRFHRPLLLSSIHPRQAALDFQTASEDAARQARNLKSEFEKKAAETQVGHSPISGILNRGEDIEQQVKIKELFHSVQYLYKQREDAVAKHKEAVRGACASSPHPLVLTLHANDCSAS
jgi:predicted Holliday junction resolvase-like endonuclease